MNGLAALLEKTVEYVNGGWHLRNPTYQENPQLLGVHPMLRDELREILPKIKIGIGFEELVEGASSMTELEAFKKINQSIQDSTKTQVVEFCSGTGIRFAHGFAKKHPNTDVVLVDELQNQHLSAGLYVHGFEAMMRAMGKTAEDARNIDLKRGFTRYATEVPYRNDVQDFMQRLFQANGTPRMNYAHQLLEEKTDLSALVDQNKTTYCVGWFCPGDAGFYALKQAVKNRAEAIALTLSGMEFTQPAQTQQLSAHKIATWHSLMEKAAADIKNPEQKFDYSKPAEQKLGFALKHARILDMLLWLQDNGYKTRLMPLEGEDKHYNGPEHIVYAFKTHDILQ